MNEQNKEPSDDDIDRIVAREQAFRKSQVNEESIRSRIQAQIAPQTIKHKHYGPRLGLPAFAAIAIIIFISLIAINETPTMEASDLIKYALDQARTTSDRHYDFSGSVLPQVFAKMPGLLGRQPWEVCTRGDRFVVRPNSPTVSVWGCDERGRPWFVKDRLLGVRYEPGELGMSAERIIKVLSLRVDVILDDLLRNWNLKIDSKHSEGENVRLVATRPSSIDRGMFDYIELFIDPSSHVVEKLILHENEEPTSGRFVFELKKVQEERDDHFRAEGYLDPDAELLDRDRPIRRQRVWRSLVGLVRESDIGDDRAK